MVRAIVIVVIGLAGAVYLGMLGWRDLSIGRAANASPTTIAYTDFVASPPAPGTVVKLTGVFVLPSCVSEDDGQGVWTAAYTGLAPASESSGGAGHRAPPSAGDPGALLILDPIDGAGDFDRLARQSSVTGLVLDPATRLDPELHALIAGNFPALDLNACPKLRGALRDTTNAGYTKLGASAAFVLLPLFNLVQTRRKS
ncbi:MAG: hypothetical protein Tsb0013_16570 [Phycisphaerales bacterium]